jgi:hypothetical protein
MQPLVDRPAALSSGADIEYRQLGAGRAFFKPAEALPAEAVPQLYAAMASGAV